MPSGPRSKRSLWRSVSIYSDRPCTLKVNHTAKVYIQRRAFEKHFSKSLGFVKVPIGLDRKLMDHPQMAFARSRIFATPQCPHPMGGADAIPGLRGYDRTLKMFHVKHLFKNVQPRLPFQGGLLCWIGKRSSAY